MLDSFGLGLLIGAAVGITILTGIFLRHLRPWGWVILIGALLALLARW